MPEDGWDDGWMVGFMLIAGQYWGVVHIYLNDLVFRGYE